MLTFLFFIIILGFLIIAHEFGHFIMARINGIKVERFAIGFGPKLFSIKGKETEFIVRLFVFLGGYVKMAGDSLPECKGQKNEFLSRAPGIKMRVVFGGPLFNYIFAFLLFWLLAIIGMPYLEPVIGQVEKGYPADTAGLQILDRIVSVNGVTVNNNWDNMQRLIQASKGQVNLTIERDGKILEKQILLKRADTVDEFGRKQQAAKIGIRPNSKFIKIKKFNFFTAFVKGGEILFSWTITILKGLGLLFSGQISIKDSISGPIGLFYITAEVVRISIVAVLQLMAILNVNLCIINLFPLPVLDGGHIFLFLIEKLRKKSISPKTEEIISNVGVALIAVLFVFVFYVDLLRFAPQWFKGNPEKDKPILENQQK